MFCSSYYSYSWFLFPFIFVLDHSILLYFFSCFLWPTLLIPFYLLFLSYNIFSFFFLSFPYLFSFSIKFSVICVLRILSSTKIHTQLQLYVFLTKNTKFKRKEVWDFFNHLWVNSVGSITTTSHEGLRGI